MSLRVCARVFFSALYACIRVCFLYLSVQMHSAPAYFLQSLHLV